jgi:uncharacterized radical SAM superfamily Fe-S cluster-containing enzyme
VNRVRPYLFYDTAVSICGRCYRKVDAKIVFENGGVWMDKRCLEHGPQRVLIADDIDYYRACREQYIKPPEMPLRRNTPVRHGCPYDCGLCPDHEQHSCLTLLEVTDVCNLRCPVCYASSGPERTTHRSLATIERMLDAIVENEGEPDIVQVSGGEPTLHPDFFAILDAARRRPIRHLMVNTNGLRIAREEGFAERLASYGPGFEIYLQFDSLRDDAIHYFRGARLAEMHLRALERLSALNLSTTLVMTVASGVNDREIGDVIRFALQQRCVRGVTIQPVQAAGRVDSYSAAEHRLTLTEVRRRILEQCGVFAPADLVPVPCHPDALCMGYALRDGDGGAIPLTGLVDREALVNGTRNTIVFEKDATMREEFVRLFSTALGAGEQESRLRDLLCCLPRIAAAESFGYGDLFRLLIVDFIDADSFDLRSVRKSCIHIAHPDGRLIPFDTYNLFYRDELERTRLGPLLDRG